MPEELKKPTVREISISEDKEKENVKNAGEKHTFHLANFNGPLDLLVTLIKEKNVSIFDVDLAELASQYLEIIKNIEPYEFDMASEYLVMGATLLQLKARMLLADPEVEEEVKKEKKRLLEQIAEYQKFKEISQVLKKQEEIRQNFYTKDPEETAEFERPIDATVLEGHANSSRLVVAIRKMFERVYAELIRNVTITTIAISPEEQKQRIIQLFKGRDELEFQEVFNVPSTGHFVITLLAILDLARQQIVIMRQDEDEGLIYFRKGEMYEE
ncbi:condensin subunit ScpA [Metamycoplasma subdolum]|uniref:Segregation and condensation protein A n=1 Tax=Metamycoplasma subdolum TaxID=92407 RepID=A0A3L9ZYF2_9BACT|nr:segregation/condensation protein A [Metamycoplasma subdolum]RMA77476.1 condensin subunit ScpA [Metamycoplasma subdolum]WPB50675.1 segregation/condensation protein A [Metamycoplasma subdolum]